MKWEPWFVAKSKRNVSNLRTQHLQLTSEAGAVLWDWALHLWVGLYQPPTVRNQLVVGHPMGVCREVNSCLAWETLRVVWAVLWVEKQISFTPGHTDW